MEYIVNVTGSCRKYKQVGNRVGFEFIPWRLCWIKDEINKLKINGNKWKSMEINPKITITTYKHIDNIKTRTFTLQHKTISI